MATGSTTDAVSTGTDQSADLAETGYSRPLRIVLLGRPDAGKSYLLGALAQAGQTQPGLLGGSFPTIPHSLQKLQQLTYDNGVAPPAEEIVGHPVTLLRKDPPGKMPAILLDCDGAAVSDLLGKLSHEHSLRGKLARAVLDADALLLVVDASANDDQLNDQFEVFGSFLHVLEAGRGRRTDASGLPVFLVLTKCDRLVDANYSFVDWIDQIEQRKNDVDAGFRDFLARKGAQDGHIPFGRIDLHIWATAMRRPSLRRLPDRSREPFGVAELFRQTFDRASAYRGRKLQSSRRLFWTSTAAILLVTCMIVGIGGLLAYNQSRAQSPLARQVELLRTQEADNPAGRLRTSTNTLQARLKQFQEIQADPQYSRLPEEDRTFIDYRSREISDYLAYYQKILALRRPADMTGEKEMQQLRKQLDGDCMLRPEWKDTVAGSVYTELDTELQILQTAVKTLQHSFRDNGDLLRTLWSFEDNRTPGPAWYDEVRDALEETRQLPYSEQGNLQGSKTLTSAMALAFLPVVRERDYYDRVRRQLEGERDLLAALGLLGRVSEAPILVIPKTFKLTDSADLLERLRKNYPNYEKDFELDRLPAAIRPYIIQAARSSYQALLPTTRERILQKFQQTGTGNQESAERWNRVRDWLLTNPEEFKEFRSLAILLGRLHEHPEPVDPVRDLANFLGKGSFEISPVELTLVAPESYGSRLPSNAELTIRLLRGGEEKGSLVYQRNFSRTSRDEETRGFRYVFVLSKGDRLTFQPGDTLRANLKLKDDEALTWINQRSDFYQFERLSSPPRRYRIGQEEEKGEEEPRVILRGAEGSIPRVPDLMPTIR